MRPTDEMILPVLAMMETLHPLSFNLKQAFRDRTFLKYLNKDEHLVMEGEYSPYLYFLVEGIVTGYRYKKGLKKMSTFISVGGDFVSVIDGMYGSTPVNESIVAYTDCCLLALHANDLLHFFEIYPEMNVLMRIILQEYYKSAHNRAVLFKMDTAEEKYAYFLKVLPALENKVPAPLLASFLDIKTDTLKRIKTKQTVEKKGIEEKAEAMQKKLSELASYILDNDLFKQKKIRLKYLAEHLDLGAHELSYFLNNVYHQSFADFINSQRVDFVKEQLKNRANFETTTIEALGDQAGFSSKTTFFFEFKKQTGFSPLEYANLWKVEQKAGY